jgi:AbrB family looped-hinge helix DNA binding protein
MNSMAIAHSKLTSQGQISVPAEVRRKLGLRPGSVLEWDERENEIVVRRAGRYSSEDIHAAVFAHGAPVVRSARQLKGGIRKHIRLRHARR